jgi:uncharacterized RDD family membrane protein YckC
MLIDGFVTSLLSGIVFFLFAIIGASLGESSYYSSGYRYSSSANGAAAIIVLFGYLLATIIALGYPIFCYKLVNGRTIGQKMLGLRLVYQDNGAKVTLGTFALYKIVGYAINGMICYLGFLWALFDSSQQTWGQKITRTVTIQSQQ